MFIAHGYHHEFPLDPGRLVAPPILSWPIAIVLVALYWSFLGQVWMVAFAGTVVGYLAYDWVHYYTHHGRPTTRVGKFVRQFHVDHHYKNHSRQFGLSSPLWDVLLGTYLAPSVPTKTTTPTEQGVPQS